MRNFHALVLGVAGALALATSALAGVAGCYGNTLVVTYPNGEVAKLHLKADGSFDVIKPDGSRSAGTYTSTAEKTCFTETPAAGAAPAAARCAPAVDGKKVGDTWQVPYPKGGMVSFAVVAGS